MNRALIEVTPAKRKYQTFTAQEVRERFRALGKSLTEWSAENGYRREEVYALLHGRTKGEYGRAYEIAVKLGMKPDPDVLKNNQDDRLWGIIRPDSDKKERG